MPRLEIVTAIAAPPRRVFDLSLQVQTHTESMAGSGEQAIDGTTTGRLRLGDQVTWQARHFGLRWRMTARVTAYDPPAGFVDEQVTGPFRRWLHRHAFEPDGIGGTVMLDTVEFAAPLGPLGVLAEVAVLNRYLHRLIRRRNAHLKAVAEAEPAG
ncbi:SRPBCC family protein [Labedaea rhizosphaerae]|uniref:Ligand-binding SRPBCC domain-containing protein n=1 Tax=Labedaea rhizosphaerae TaxID=598644 RepID=A0A4V3CZU7_LABRH|nr:SRPBCC family protein [Labedaea rhizosphaerae]TDQ01131.1 ligand-binding SRPBCC domain-containing protein [Labedaea rhizosphaerae]